jgi:hypothetical protein
MIPIIENPTTTSEAIQAQIKLNINAIREQIALISAATREESRFGYQFAHQRTKLRFDALHNRIAESHDHLAKPIIRHFDESTSVIEAPTPRHERSPPHPSHP